MPDCEVLTWIAPDGVETVLTGTDEVMAAEGIAGRGMPPIRVTAEVVPLQPGQRLRNLEHDAREVAVPLVFFDATLTEVRAILRGMLRRFDPARGDGVLRAVTADGIERQLTCRYIGGLEFVEGPADRGLSPEQSAQRATAVFQAFDPYWYDVDPYEAEYAVLAPASSTFLPIPNATSGSFVTLIESEVFTTGTITLTADVDGQSWPVWTLTGPGSDIALTNDTTGDTIDLSADGGLTLLDGEVVIIDTRPGAKTIKRSTGENVMNYLTSASRLWPLDPTQEVTISVSGASIDTLVALSVYAAHLTV